MAILSVDQVLMLAKTPANKRIKAMRDEAEELAVHYFGDRADVAAYLTTLSGFESDHRRKLREDLAIANNFLVQDLLRPADNLWSAKGGSRKLGIESDTARDLLRSKIADAADGAGLRNYMKDVWFERFVVDPNGLIFMENDEQEAWPTFKSIEVIRSYSLSGYRVEWVCFEPDFQDENSQRLWVVDDAYWYRVELKGDKATLLEDLSIKNAFGRVPGVVNSGIQNTAKGYRDSLISKQLDLLRSYLNKNSRKEVHQNFHDYPIAWEYETVCPVCKGARRIMKDNASEVCPTCAGTGLSSTKDPSIVRVLRNPTEDQPGAPTPPAGYVQPDIATMAAQRTELDWVFDKMFFSLWGATTERAENETATGRFIDAQPVNNQLTSLSDMAEDVEKILIDLMGAYYTPGLYKAEETVLLYGKRFMIETPDQIWNKYLKAKTDKAPEATKTLLLEQYYESEFQNDPYSFEYYSRLIALEPFVHNTVDEVNSWPFAANSDKQAKIYFQQWLDTKSKADIVSTDIEKLRQELKVYAAAQLVNIIT